jgi:uncharacterized transporter YbjL
MNDTVTTILIVIFLLGIGACAGFVFALTLTGDFPTACESISHTI